MKDTICLHHTADDSSGKQYRKTYAYHNNGAPRSDNTLRWNPGRGIQYHFFIERDGELIGEGREDDLLYHAGKWNYRSIGICLAGNFLNETPTLAQLETLYKLIEDLKTRHDIKFIYNHYEIRPTACPVVDLRELYEHERRRRRLVITGATIRRKIRKLRRLIRDSSGELKEMYKRRRERIKMRLDPSIFDDRDCCAD